MKYKNGGFVIIYTLWIMSALFVMLFIASVSVQSTYFGESIKRDRLAFIFESQAVARIALWRLLNSYPPTYTGILALPYLTEISVMNRTYEVIIEAEDSKVPINRLDTNGYERFAETLLGNKDVGKLIFEYVQRNGHIDSINELYNLIGEDAFFKVKKIITAYAPRLNLNYASYESLIIIGLSRNDIEAIISRRKYGVINIMDVNNAFNEHILLKYVISTPRPSYYRVRVKMKKPFVLEVEYILSPDVKILDRI